jgi:DNA-binding SARP family transcriptional activator/Tfp pilus assembly protein PilF
VLEFRILGPLEIWRDGDLVAVEAARERAVLAALLLQANRVVAADRLIELLWGEDPPAKARNTVQTWVWRLRRRLEPAAAAAAEVLVTRPPGYLLRIEPDQLDLLRFEALHQRGRQAIAAGSVAEAAALFGEALSLWRGEPLADVGAEWLRRLELPRLAELHLQVVEARLGAELQLGRHAEQIGELRGMVADHPLRERLSEQLMLALYRSGRQAEALETYRAVRRALADELGVEPGPALQRLHGAVLRADPALDLSTPDAAPAVVRASAGPRPPAQLPADVSAFTGRADYLRTLDRLLAAENASRAVAICAITGTAGVGKTALAVHWAHRARHRFPDGQLYVNLRGYASGTPVRPVEALSRFLRALGVPAEQVPLDVDEASDTYRTLLADRQMLIVLDNAHSAEQVRPLLPGSPGSVVLVTSRDRLGGLVARDGAHRVTLDVLAQAESGSLLSRILGADRVAAEPDAAAELAEVCAHLPLALRIAAANLTGHPEHSIAGYAGELRAGNRLAALQVHGDEEAAVRAAFDLSYAALPTAGQRAFRLLGMVPGPDVTVGATAALVASVESRAAHLLEQLAGAHLLDQHARGRYAWHDLLRLYARQRCLTEESEPDREAAIGRLYDFYLHTADAAATLLYPEKLRLPLPAAGTGARTIGFDDPAQALAWLDAERPNLVAAVREAAENDQRPVAWLLADALRGYFYLRMYTVDWLAVAGAGLDAARAGGDARGQAAAHISLADLDWRHGAHRQAITHYAEALRISRETGWLEGQATVLVNLGTVYWQSGRLEQAADHYRQALVLNQRTGRLAGQATSLGNLGTVDWELGRLAEAADHHTEALALHRKIGSRGGEALAFNNLGETYHVLGRLDDALAHLSQALTLHREIGNRGSEAETLRCLAAVHRDAGRLDEAIELASSALAVSRETGNRRSETDALNTRAATHHRRGEPVPAVELHEQALRQARDLNSRYPEAEALLGLAAAHLAAAPMSGVSGSGASGSGGGASGSGGGASGSGGGASAGGQRALASARQALLVAHHNHYRVLEAQALTALAAVRLDSGDIEAAIDHAEQALAGHRETDHLLGLARTHLLLADALHRAGRAEVAQRHRHQAMGLFGAVGSPPTGPLGWPPLA